MHSFQASFQRAQRVLQALAWLVLGWAALHAGLTFLARCSHPFQLEWSEGSTFLQAVRLLETGEIYADPWAGLFVPHLYPPLHTFALAGLLTFLPAGLATGRALSLVATLLAALFLLATARRAGAGRVAALSAPLALFALAPAVDYWHDLVRVDMLFLAIFAGSLLLLAHASAAGGRSALFGSALLLVLACLAKQSALAYGPAFFLVLWATRGWRSAFQWGGVAAAALCASLALLQAWSEGWFWYYAFTVLGRHPGLEGPEKWGHMWASLLPLAPVLIASLFAWPIFRRPAVGEAGPARLLVGLTLWGFPFAVYAFLKHGGFTNAWLPVLATALPAAAACRPGLLGLAGAALSAGLLLFPLLSSPLEHPARLFCNPAQLPLPEDRAAQEAVVAELSELEGGVWCPEDIWVTYLATGEILPLLHLVGELMEGQRLPRALGERIDRRGFSALLFSESVFAPGRTTLDLLATDPRFQGLHARILAAYDPLEATRLSWPSKAAGYQRVGLFFRPSLLVPPREEP